jgi:DNA-binding XRE family transcriptional regulator
LEHTRKRHTELRSEASFVGPKEKIDRLKEYAKQIGLTDASESLTIAEAFPAYGDNPLGLALRGARHREGMTQRELAAVTGIPQRHISEMESGKRQIGRERAKKLADALHVADYRVFL